MSRYVLVVWFILAAAALCQDTGITGVVSPGLLKLSKPELVYIVHWTSEEKCYECNYRNAVGCMQQTPDCGVPMKTVDHFESVGTKGIALDIANEISDSKSFAWNEQSPYWIGSTQVLSASRPKGTLVAIYEARPLPVKRESKDIEIPQPPKIEKKVVITLAPDSK